MSVELHHRFDGPEDAPVVLLSNSLGTALDMWDDHVPGLAARFRVLRYDLRGHGRSPVVEGSCTIDDLGRDVLALLDRLEIERASVGGVSLGGMTAMWLGIHAPERVDRLALCCISAHLPPPESWHERAAAVRAGGMEAVVDAVLERWFTPAARERGIDAVVRTRASLLATEPEGYAACCAAIADLDLRAELPGIAAPTLVVVAADDPSTPPAHGAAVAEAVPGARLVMLPDARHLVAVERPADVAGPVLDHLTAGS
jgi:3-oxoadipate enol-lactonase